MKRRSAFTALIAATLLTLGASAALAKAPATVEAVQAPAWLDRAGKTQPLTPGMELRNGDVLRTGEGARAYVLLAEGSRVKLAESARFTLFAQGREPEKKFRGLLDIAAGAFRYTTAKVAKPAPKELSIKVGTATVGIRGTDIWGRSTRDGELVALLTGRIAITRDGQTTELAQPMTYFDAPKGQASDVKILQPEVFRTLARETEIMPGDGATNRKGKWSLLAATTSNRDAALELYDRLRDAGYAARIKPRQDIVAGQGWDFSVLLSGYASEAEAKAAAERIKAKTGIEAQPVK